MPRLELVTAFDEQTLQVHLISPEAISWEIVLAGVRQLKASEAYRVRDPNQMAIRLECIAFTDDCTQEQARELLEQSSGLAALEANSCTWKSDKTSLNFLMEVVERLGAEPSRHLLAFMPSKIHISSPTAEDLSVEEESSVDERTTSLLFRFVENCGKWPQFLGARNGLISRKQGSRLALQDARSHAVVVAAIYATRVHAFLGHIPTDLEDEGLGEWLRKQQLMPMARAVFLRFFDVDKLLMQELHVAAQRFS